MRRSNVGEKVVITIEARPSFFKFGSRKSKNIKPSRRLTGSVRLRGDKSISHRSAMLAAIADGPSEIHYFSSSADCRSTLACLENLGVKVERQEREDWLTVQGRGLKGLRAPDRRLDAGNSGSTMRMLAGILAGQPFRSVIAGDASLSHRPMKRVVEPLASMGARIQTAEGGLPPLEIEGGVLKPVRY